MKKTLLVLLLASISSGCAIMHSRSYSDAPPAMGAIYSKYAYLAYDGDVKPFEEVGVITTDGRINLRSVDGRAMTSFTKFRDGGLYANGRYQVHLEPGEHDIEMGFIEGSAGVMSWSTTTVTKKLIINKGQVVHLELARSRGKWTSQEFDGSKDLAMMKADFEALVAKGAQ